MKLFAFLSIRRKLTLIIIGTVTAVLLFVGVSFMIYEVTSTRQMLVRGLDVRTQILSANLSAATLFDDQAAAEEILLALKVDPHVMGAWVRTKTNGMFAQYNRDLAHPGAVPSTDIQTGLYFRNNSLINVSPIFSDGKVIGIITLSSDLGILYDRLWPAGIITGIVLLISSLMGIWISNKVQQMVSDPIMKLATLAQRVTEEKNYMLRSTETHQGDEIGVLGEAFNHMLDQLAAQNALLANVNQMLEERIQERTKEILNAEKFLDSIIENIPNMVFIKDARDLKFIRFNKAGQDLIGFSQEALLGKNDYDFFPKDQAQFFIAKDREVLRGKKIVDISEEPIQTKEKGERILHTKKVPVLDEQGDPRYLLGISEDITQMKQAQAELLKKTEQLARSRMEIEQLELFAFAATHDLKEPLRAIHFYADLLKTQISGQLDEETLANFNRIQNAADRLSGMMEQMRELSRIGTEEGSFQKVDLNWVAQEVIQRIEFVIREAGAQVKIDDLPPILGDQTQMLLLFQNLISNSVKFKKKGGPSPIVHIQGCVLKGGGLAEITVEDNGIGFDKKYLERIFKPFQRLHGKSEYAGTGLGLAICRKIVIWHGGTITAESAPGQGSKFIITLPVYCATISSGKSGGG